MAALNAHTKPAQLSRFEDHHVPLHAGKVVPPQFGDSAKYTGTDIGCFGLDGSPRRHCQRPTDSFRKRSGYFRWCDSAHRNEEAPHKLQRVQGHDLYLRLRQDPSFWFPGQSGKKARAPCVPPFCPPCNLLAKAQAPRSPLHLAPGTTVPSLPGNTRVDRTAQRPSAIGSPPNSDTGPHDPSPAPYFHPNFPPSQSGLTRGAPEIPIHGHQSPLSRRDRPTLSPNPSQTFPILAVRCRPKSSNPH
jgi:hypothetical protein